ncbi:hypothetical protein chiPu_0027333, partial [Chiloscyllium punctatum]|nr:hypothetical protein [Chiloscyllium punctatum]
MMSAHAQQKPIPPPARPGLGQGVPGQTLLVPPMSKPQGVLPGRAPGPKVASVQASGLAQASGLPQASGPAQASGLPQASGPAQASGPGPVQHSTASTQTPALGLDPVPQTPGEPGQPQLQASSGPHNVGLPPQLPLP